MGTVPLRGQGGTLQEAVSQSMNTGPLCALQGMMGDLLALLLVSFPTQTKTTGTRLHRVCVCLCVYDSPKHVHVVTRSDTSTD